MILVHQIGSTFITGWPTAVSAWRVLIYRSPCPGRGCLPAERKGVRIRRLVTQQLVSTGEAVGKCDQPSMISSNAAILIVAKVENVSEIA